MLPPSPKSRILPITLALLLATLAATQLDFPIAVWVHAHAPLDEKNTLKFILKAPGQAYTTALIALLLAIFHKDRLRAPALLALAALFSWANALIKFLFGRTRPYKFPEDQTQPHPFSLHPLQNIKDLSFPSGHASLEFATAVALGFLLPKYRWLFLPLAALCASERILENAHWLSDVVGGITLGYLSASLALCILNRFNNPSMLNSTTTP